MALRCSTAALPSFVQRTVPRRNRIHNGDSVAEGCPNALETPLQSQNFLIANGINFLIALQNIVPPLFICRRHLKGNVRTLPVHVITTNPHIIRWYLATSHRFRPDIQGLRAIAVLPVVIFHALPAYLPGGFVGVDIFFVISGYLITGIIFRELKEERFSIVGFYARRMKRLFPALYAMLIGTLLIGLTLLPPPELVELAHTAIGTIGFFANFLLYNLSGYFAGDSEFKPLLHTWSLAVEEQFYLVFPLLLAAVYRYYPKIIPHMLFSLLIASLSWSVIELQHDASRAFYYPLPRAFELLIGAIVAVGVFPKIESTVVRHCLSLVGIGLIATAIIGFSARTPFPGLAAIVPCLGAALILAMGETKKTFGGQVLSMRPLVFVGSLSYSLYLWHWPTIVFSRYYLQRELTPPEAGIAVASSITIALISWFFIERPVLEIRTAQRNFVLAGALTMAAGTAAAAAIIQSNGLPARLTKVGQSMIASADDISPYRRSCHSEEKSTIAYNQLCVLGSKVAIPTTAVWGDSYGVEFAAALGEKLIRDNKSLIQITGSGCPPAPGFDTYKRPNCGAYNSERLKNLLRDKRIRRVYLIANYLGMQEDAPESMENLYDGIAWSATALHIGGKEVTIVLPIPRMPFDAPTALAVRELMGRNPYTFGQTRADFDAQSSQITKRLHEIAKQASATVVDSKSVLCNRSLCPAYIRGPGVIYFDRGHMSMSGARHLLSTMP